MIEQLDFLDKRLSDKLINSLTNDRHKLAFMIMLDCGLRVSETITLQLSNFDFKNKSLTVRSLKKRDEVSHRKIPLSDRLYEELASFIKSMENPSPESYLFAGTMGRDHISRKALNRVCERFREKFPEFSKLHPHTLRHTCATQLLANGAQLHEIKEILGHKKYDTTLIYSHIPQELLRERINSMSKEKLSIWSMIFNFISPPSKPSVINLSTNKNNFIIGRNTELATAIELVNKNVNTILIGGIGSGKTHILNHITPNKKILRFDDFSDLKKTLIQGLLFLYKNDKEEIFKMLYGDYDLSKVTANLQKDSISNICKEIIKITKKHEYVLVIDNCDNITPRGIKALEELKDHFTILTTARQVPVNKSSFLWNFQIIKVKNLERHNTLELIHKLAYDLDVEDFELFRNHIFEQSDGNPRVIFELVERFRKEAVVSADIVRSVRHFGSMREFDMSFIVMLVLASLAIMRYLSAEVGNDSLKFIGGCAMVLLIFSRYLFSFSKRKFI